jgi:hypothetical protein
MPPELRRFVLKRDKSTCQECGYIGGQNKYDIHVHHIYPYRLGGEHVETNLITLCSYHHNQRDKEHKLKLRGMNLPKPKHKKRIREVKPIEKTIYDEKLTQRAIYKIIKVLKSKGHRARFAKGVTPLEIANYFEPGDVEARQGLLRLICETAGIQPKG